MKKLIAFLVSVSPAAAQDILIPLPGGYPGHHEYQDDRYRGDRNDRPHEYDRHYGDAYEGDRPRHHHRGHWHDGVWYYDR